MNSKVLVLILNYKSYQDTINYTYNILNQKNINVDVLIVDNDSQNSSFENLSKEFVNNSRVRVIESEKNGGYAYGNNFGLKYIEKEDYNYIVISNNDIIIDDELLLYKLTERYSSLHKPAFLSPVQTNKGLPYSAAWKIPTIQSDIFSNIPILNKLYKKFNSYNLNSEDVTIPVDVLPGSFYLFKKEIIYNLGLLDEATFLYGEERILAYKIKKMNLQNYLALDLSYEHEQSKTISSNLSKLKMIKLSHESSIYYHQHYKKSSKLGIFILKTLYSIIQNRLNN
jgi:GT2 family glycosyltransferase